MATTNQLNISKERTKSEAKDVEIDFVDTKNTGEIEFVDQLQEKERIERGND